MATETTLPVTIWKIVMTVLAGLNELRHEVSAGTTAVAFAVRTELARLIRIEAFADAIAGHFMGDVVGQNFARVVRDWLVHLPR